MTIRDLDLKCPKCGSYIMTGIYYRGLHSPRYEISCEKEHYRIISKEEYRKAYRVNVYKSCLMFLKPDERFIQLMGLIGAEP